jgi:hypothetical protein
MSGQVKNNVGPFPWSCTISSRSAFTVNDLRIYLGNYPTAVLLEDREFLGDGIWKYTVSFLIEDDAIKSRLGWPPDQ